MISIQFDFLMQKLSFFTDTTWNGTSTLPTQLGIVLVLYRQSFPRATCVHVNLYTLVTINKTSRYSKGNSASSQTCQDDTNLSEILTEAEKVMIHSIARGTAQSLVHKPRIIRT